MPTAAAKPESATAAQAPHVEKPKHPLSALTTYELREYRCQLENAIAFFDRQEPAPAVRDDRQAALAAVTSEQESRDRLTRG